MTIFETITGLTLLFVGLVASVTFYHQIDCYHGLTVQAVELRLKPLEHDDKTTLSFNSKCSGAIKRSNDLVHVQFKTNYYKLTLPLKGQL